MLFIRVTIMIAVLTGIIYSIYKINTQGVSKDLFYLEQTNASFDLAAVKKFEWRTKNKISSLEKDPSGKWIPFDREKKIQEILTTLATLALSPIEQKGTPQISVALDVYDETWMGAWDGLTFLWTQGPKKGLGAVLTETQNILFFKGRFVFEPDLALNLCGNRVTQIKITINSKEYDIAQTKRGWTVTGGVEKPLDPIFVEKWLIQSCAVKVKTVMDPAYTSGVSERVNRIVLTYVDKTKLDFFNIENDLVMMNDRAVLLIGYKALFEDLKSHVLPAQK